jgi:hypothetical protein
MGQEDPSSNAARAERRLAVEKNLLKMFCGCILDLGRETQALPQKI